MSDAAKRFHELWLGMVQPIEGLVVSTPVLVDAQCMERQSPNVQEALRRLCPPTPPSSLARGQAPLSADGEPSSTAAGMATLADDARAQAQRGHRRSRSSEAHLARTSRSIGQANDAIAQAIAQAEAVDDALQADTETRVITDLEAFLSEVLELTPDKFDRADSLPEDLELFVSEGFQQQRLRPTLALRKIDDDTEAAQTAPEPSGGTDDARTAAAIAGEPYVMLVWELPLGLPLYKPETVTGEWEYPPTAKFERLLRHCRVPIGLLCNGQTLRLVYAPHGESSGSIDFHVEYMARPDGRPILDAMVMLLSDTRFFGVRHEHQLPALLSASRKRQADVTTKLAVQVFGAIEILLRGFEAASERDGRDLLEQVPSTAADDHLYGGLLTTLLRIVFLLYSEDRNLLPVDHPVYTRSLSVLSLFAELQSDRGSFPDTMHQRFGAWGRLLAIFRAVYRGVAHGTLELPARRGDLFDPNVYPFLEGWGPEGSAPIIRAKNRASVRLPSISDGVICEVLERLIVLDGQRLSYKALDVEQIGSVYEGLMGYHVLRLEAPAVCMRPNRVWLTTQDVLAQPAALRVNWLKDTTGLPKAQADKLAAAIKACGSKNDESVLKALEDYAAKGTQPRQAGRLILQPGHERQRTSAHYTPRSLTAPIVQRTVEPLLRSLGDEPSSEAILSLKLCDPAMGSGAFLVETCRFVADQVVKAWERENKRELLGSTTEDATNYARRLVAQRCLYGVDKNPFAVNLAKMSLWLVTLAKDLPFTFVDHALRCGDSLVGLDFDQIRSFHWQANGQLPLCAQEIEQALSEAVAARKRILELAYEPGAAVQREKERLLKDAEDALGRVRLIGDLVVGAFFAGKNAKEREAERKRREGLLLSWLTRDEPPSEELRALQRAVTERVRTFHWMAEYPEIFYEGRADPLTRGTNAETPSVAHMDGFMGNPPFAGKNGIFDLGGDNYLDWLQALHPGAHGNADYCTHFFRRADALLGDHGSTGLVATNTIWQGDTRTTGLAWLVRNGHDIYDAIESMPWPGNAAVTVAAVHLAKGHTKRHAAGSRFNSRGKQRPERDDPRQLAANASLSFVGSYILGMGFTLTPEERDELVARNKKNAERIFPYIGGEEVNTSPEQTFHRYVINFGNMTLEETGRWPDLISIVREKVKPERDKNKREVRRKYWWRFGEVAPALYDALRGLPRCLVNSRVTKHLMFTFQPTDRVFAESLYAYPLPTHTHFAILQSRIHEPWARLLSSSMKTDLRYAASDCFETFPFPQDNPRAPIPELESIGQRLYDTRAAYMTGTDQGLTKTYNALKKTEVTDPRIVELRTLHEEMDRAVLNAYGWSDIPVPAYGTPTSSAEERALEAFKDEVIDRLFARNAELAQREAIQGKSASKKKAQSKGQGRAKRASHTQSELPATSPSVAAPQAATDAHPAPIAAAAGTRRPAQRTDKRSGSQSVADPNSDSVTASHAPTAKKGQPPSITKRRDTRLADGTSPPASAGKGSKPKSKRPRGSTTASKNR